MSFLSEHMTRLAESVRAQTERARAGSGHSGIKGAAIEVVLRNLLRQYVPTTFSIGTGQFANADGELSPQVDVLVYDAAVFPHLSVNEDGSVVVCGESVFAVAECKAQWDAAEVANHFRRFCSVALKCRGPWESDGEQNRERAAYFAFMLEAPARPDMTALEDANRAGLGGEGGEFSIASSGRSSGVPRLPRAGLSGWVQERLVAYSEGALRLGKT